MVYPVDEVPGPPNRKRYAYEIVMGRLSSFFQETTIHVCDSSDIGAIARAHEYMAEKKWAHDFHVKSMKKLFELL